MSDAPLDVYIAGYDDPVSAKADFDALKKAQREGIVFIDGAILVNRDADGTMHVTESGDHDVFKGATVGVAGGFVLGLFAPPLLGAMVVGGAIGGLIGKLSQASRGEGHRQGRRRRHRARQVGRGRRLRGDLGRRGRKSAGQGQQEGGQAGRQEDRRRAQEDARADQEAGCVKGAQAQPHKFWRLARPARPSQGRRAGRAISQSCSATSSRPVALRLGRSPDSGSAHVKEPAPRRSPA